MSSSSIHKRLSSFSTCEISDALIKLGLPQGGHIPDINLLSPSPTANIKICAPAYTVRMVMVSDTTAPKLSSHFVDTAPEGSVIVIDAPPQAKNAVWGGLMTAGAQARSVLGVIISGRCRDIAEHREAGFPVFARGHSSLAQSPFTRPSAVNIPITISPLEKFASLDFPAVTVHPGDWMIADPDGVVCVPRELEEKVVVLATYGKVVDSRCLEDIRAGKGVQESFKTHRGK